MKNIVPLNSIHLHQQGGFYMLGAASIKGRLLLESGFYWGKYGNTNILSFVLHRMIIG